MSLSNLQLQLCRFIHCPKLIVGGEQMVEVAYYGHVYYGHASLGMLLNAK